MRAVARIAAATVGLLLTAGLAGCTPPPDRDATPTLRTAVVEPAVAPQDDFGAFIVPLWIGVPPDLIRDHQEARLVTWTLAGQVDEGVRLMAPTTVRPDGTHARPAPRTYADHLLGLAARGARISEDMPIRIDGAFGRRFTLTVPGTIQAGLGCWSPAPADCFSLAAGVTLRIATVTVHGRPIVLWARTWKARPSAALDTAFDRVLDTLTFVDRSAYSDTDGRRGDQSERPEHPGTGAET